MQLAPFGAQHDEDWAHVPQLLWQVPYNGSNVSGAHDQQHEPFSQTLPAQQSAELWQVPPYHGQQVPPRHAREQHSELALHSCVPPFLPVAQVVGRPPPEVPEGHASAEHTC